MTGQSLGIVQKYWKPGTSRVLSLVILVILFFFATSFYLYVSQNYSYLVERNFRLLATWGTELTETFENYERSFRFRVQEDSASLAKPPSHIPSHGRLPTLTDEGLVLEGFAPMAKPDDTSPNKPEYELLLEQQTREQLNLLPFSYVQTVEPPKPLSGQPSSKPETVLPTVTFSYSTNQADGLVQAKAQKHDGTMAATASINLGDLLNNIATQTIYHDVLLADPSGTIIYQRNPSTLRFFHLSNLLHHQRIEEGLLTNVLTEGGLKQSPDLNPQNLSHVMKTAMPSHFQMTVGGNSYEVFMQAVTFPSITHSSKGENENVPWIMCGILPSTTFQEQYLAIPFTALLFGMFVFISAFLALPFFSLMMMKPRERLTRFSVISLLITNILGAGIGTLFLLDLGFYRQTISDFHDRLTATTDSVAEAFDTQLDRMVWQIDRYNHQFHELNDRERFPKEHNSKAWLARVNLPDPCKDAQGNSLPFCYPEFSVAFWADGEGILRETWTQTLTPYVRGTHNLRQRDYVTKVQTNPKHLHRRKINNRWLEFYAQPLISLESSTRSLVVSMPHWASSDPQTTAVPWVAAIQSEEFSLLKKPVLAQGIGYAVIEDQTGLVLFHSDGRRMLRENFLEETDDNPEVSALLHARAKGLVEGVYWGIGHRFAIKPLAGLPWTLVVFESKETFRTTNFEVLLFSLALFTLYILSLLLWLKTLTVMYAFDPLGKRIRWTWPKPGLLRTYQWLSLAQLVIFILGLTFLFGLDWQSGMNLSNRTFLALLPFLTIWLVVRVLWKGHAIPHAENSEHANNPWALLQTPKLIRVFTRFSVVSFLLLGVLPAIVFFKVAHDQEMRLFAQHQLWGLAQSLGQATQGPWFAKGTGENTHDFQFLTAPTKCLIEGCQTGKQSKPMVPSTGCVPKSSTTAAPDLQYSLQNIFSSLPLATCMTFDSKSWDPQEIIRPSWFDRLHQLIRKSSLQIPMNKESWGFLHAPSASDTKNWGQHMNDGQQRVTLRLTDFRQEREKAAGFGPLHLSLWTTLFPWNLSSRLLPILAIAGFLIVIGYAIVQYMIRKIYAFPSFFHRSHEVGESAFPQPGSSLEHLLVVGPPGFGKSHLAVKFGPSCPILDMHETYGKDTWAEHMAGSLPAHTKTVILDHFEYQWEDPVQRKEKGILVERLLARGLKVCIFSTRDPMEWTRAPAINPIEHDQDATQTYWIDLFGSFGFIHFTPNRMEAFLQEWLHPQADLHGVTGPTLPVKSCLNQESLPTVHLERIGKWIRSFQEWATWTPRQMQEQFLQIGWPYYQAIWQSCSLTEKIALYHIAVDGYMHADNPALTSLSQKGLIRLTPDLQLMNDSFGHYVLQLGENLQLSKWEKQTRPNTWGQLKWPFLFIFGAVLLFFFFTQQEFKNSFITLISLLPILLPALPDLPALLGGAKNTQISSD